MKPNRQHRDQRQILRMIVKFIDLAYKIRGLNRQKQGW
jgi:hypothetical protein